MKMLAIALFGGALSFMQPDYVYICRSGTCYAYHTKLCRGLAKCTHRIDTATVKQAVASGHGKMCGYCAR